MEVDRNYGSSDDFKPRNYQRQMADICMKKNTIIYLPTGAGKTFIALMVLKEMAKDLQRPPSEGGKRSIFIVNTVALAKQQAEFISKTTPLKTSVYTSDLNVDAWKKDKWLTEFETNQIIVCTAQIIVDVLKFNYLSVKHINLFIFDECHHGLGGHPMHNIMEMFQGVAKADQPRVIGLSGMLLYRQLKSEVMVSDELQKLENVYMATIATVGSYDEYTEVLTFSTNPAEKLIGFNISPPSPLSETIKGMIANICKKVSSYHLPKCSDISKKTLLRDRPSPIKETVKSFKSFVYQMEDTGLYGASIAILGLIVEFELAKRTSESNALRQLYRYCIAECDTIRHLLQQSMDGYSKTEMIERFSTQKLFNLLQYLEIFCKNHKSVETKCLVFVQRRFSAKCIYHILKMYADSVDDSCIKPDFMVGNNAFMPESIESILEAKVNRRVLESFRKGETNVIITTSVLEEGMDLQMCNLVIKYDHPHSFASYVQSKGRARMKESEYVIMYDKAIQGKLLNEIRLYKQIEKELQKCLVGKTINRPEPLESDVEKELYDHEIPPFITETGARLDASSCIQLLNRYTMTMPKDNFTNTSVIWSRVDSSDNKVVVSVSLPMQSSIKDTIWSEPKASVRMAKRAAAFKACIALYRNGDLAKNLMPIDSRAMIKIVSDDYLKLWKSFPKDDPKIAGTKGNIRAHDIQYPHQLTACSPYPGTKCYIYIIRMKAEFPNETNNSNIEIFRNLYNSENNFGIMTTKTLPELAAMKFFVTLGLINVQIIPAPVEVIIGSETELNSLRKFHVMVFRDILQIWKSFFVYDFSNTSNSFFVVPMKDNLTIDWELVNNFQYLEKPREKIVSEIKKMDFKPKDYLHKVVHPWYKSERDRHYVVTHVWEHLTPDSPFPNDEYSTYAHYFSKTYHQQIVRKDQFLIEVKGITTKLNRLCPGGDDDGRSTKAKHWEFQELLIPELCFNFGFPADFWLKATILPSILHRLHYLLLAENIRVDLATNVRIGTLKNSVMDPLEAEYSKSSNKFEEEADDYCDDTEDSDDEFNKNNTINAITFPNPETTVAQIASMELTSISNEVHAPWKDDEEPMDIHRHWSTVHSFEIDYYEAFVTKFDHLDIGEKLATQNQKLLTMNKHRMASRLKTEAILDQSLDDKFTIKLLNLTIENTKHVHLQQKDLIKALTTTSGDVFDMERYEVLGDAFLKFVVSFYLLTKHPKWHEGYLTSVKGRIVSNRNLLYCGMKAKISGMIKVDNFSPSNDFTPPLLKVPANIQQKMREVNAPASQLYKLVLTEEEVLTGHVNPVTSENFMQYFLDNNPPSSSPMQAFISEHSVPDKTVADCMESLLGVCVNSCGVERSLNFLPYFNILPRDENIMNLLSQAMLSPRSKGTDDPEIDAFLVNYRTIEEKLGYQFKDRAYLLQALTHGSYPTNRFTSSYERLEFLGDAVLDFLISSYIFEQCPHMDPGKLTDLRSALVNNVTLACILVRNYLHLYILSESAQLLDIMTKFVAFQEENDHEITDQIQLLVEERDLSIADYVDVPKVLGDVMESLIGAIFLDSGCDLKRTWKVIYTLLQKEITSFMVNVPINIVRQLYEFKGAYPKFSEAIVHDDIITVKLRYTCRKEILTVHGFGQNKDDAKKAAAKVALQRLRRQ